MYLFDGDIQLPAYTGRMISISPFLSCKSVWSLRRPYMMFIKLTCRYAAYHKKMEGGTLPVSFFPFFYDLWRSVSLPCVAGLPSWLLWLRHLPSPNSSRRRRWGGISAVSLISNVGIVSLVQQSMDILSCFMGITVSVRIWRKESYIGRSIRPLRRVETWFLLFFFIIIIGNLTDFFSRFRGQLFFSFVKNKKLEI